MTKNMAKLKMKYIITLILKKNDEVIYRSLLYNFSPGNNTNKQKIK